MILKPWFMQVATILFLVGLWCVGTQAIAVTGAPSGAQSNPTTIPDPSPLEAEKLHVEKERLSLERVKFEYEKEPWTWQWGQKVLGTIYSGFATVGIVAGGSWAFFKFARYRTLKPRVEFAFNWTRSDDDESYCLGILTMKLTNRGNTKVDLRRKQEPRCFLKYALISETVPEGPVSLLSVPSKQLEHLDTVFQAHKWIEPGETIDDVKIVRIKRENHLAIQLEILAFGAKNIKYTASTAFPLIGTLLAEGSESEDEEDKYEEAEAVREGLLSVRARIKRLSATERTRLDELVHEVDVLLQRDDGGRASVREAERLITRAEQCLRSMK